LKPLSDADTTHATTPWPIHLFRFPASAIREVILGFSLGAEARERALHRLSRTDLLHAAVYDVEVKRNAYGLSRRVVR
jgi:hypothetical protein